MRTETPRGVIRPITAALALLCVLRPEVAGGQTKTPPKSTDMNVLAASIRGVSLGMTPRRVLLETQKHNWTYRRSSTDTLEDIIDHNPSSTSIYLDLNEPGTSDVGFLNSNSIAVHFAWDNASTKQLRVVMVVHTYDIPVSQYSAVLETAKAELTALGGFKETLKEEPQFEHRLTYQKVDRSYIMYQLIKPRRDSSFVTVSRTICSY